MESVISILFDQLFPAYLLNAAGRVWSGSCPACRQELMLAAFDDWIELPTLAHWDWEEFDEYAQAALTLAMHEWAKDHLSAEIAASATTRQDAITLAADSALVH